jgi:hypothetical protein
VDIVMQRQQQQNDEFIEMTVYYFENGKSLLDAFGHVAIGFNSEQLPLNERRDYLKESDKGYFSYGSIASNEVAAPLRENTKSLAGDAEHYGKAPIEIKLSVPKAHLLTASREIGGWDRKQYNLNSKNCAHAVYQFLQTLQIGIKDVNKSLLLPSTVAALAVNKVAKNIADERETLLSALQDLQGVVYEHQLEDTSSLSIIQNLIGNDIKRLQNESLLNSFKASSDDQAVKDKKIQTLQALVTELKQNPANYELHHQLLSNATHELDGKTRDGLKACLQHFPCEKLSLLDEKKQALLELKEMINNLSRWESLSSGLPDFKPFVKDISQQSSPAHVQDAFEKVRERLEVKLTNGKARSPGAQYVYTDLKGKLDEINIAALYPDNHAQLSGLLNAIGSAESYVPAKPIELGSNKSLSLSDIQLDSSSISEPSAMRVR